MRRSFRPTCGDQAKYQLFTGDAQWFSDNIPCMTACPSHTDISRYIALIADGRYADSYELNREHNVFPGCLGRMCARPCEEACRRKEVDAPIGIRYLKRVASDFRGETRRDVPGPPNGMRAAIIGAGVSGLTTARQLARKGYEVEVFEKFPVPGGVMWTGVPEWRRLPRDIVMEEVEQILQLGIRVSFNVEIGKDRSFQSLVEDYDVVVMANGCQIATGLGIPGEDLNGVVSGLQFLEDVNLGHKDVWVPKRVVTVGGGFTSMDCVRTVVRMGADTSIMTYRRSIQEIPVDEIEIEEAEIEGVEIQFMVSPTRVIGDENGNVTGLEVVRNELGAPDARGRRRPEPVAGSEYVIPCEMVLVAIGQKQDPGFLAKRYRTAIAAEFRILDENLRTELPNVWAVGDFVINPTNFISAIGEGRRVAESIDRTGARDPTDRQGHGDHPGSDRICLDPKHPACRRRGRVVADLDEPSFGVGRRLFPGRSPDDAITSVPDRGMLNTGDTMLEVEVGYSKPIVRGSQALLAVPSSTSSSMATGAFLQRMC
ncbi:MAG: FAD-dependent oxidoreductase [Thermomicrobiales bacterium]